VAALKAVREVVGFNAPALVVSDGTPGDLRQLLAIDGVSLVRPGCAISDLLTLAKARVLIGSGGSSFSAWASFLGGMPTISHPGQSLNWFRLAVDKGAYVGEFDPAAPHPLFCEQVATSYPPR
jgi:hypothetical protein